MPEEAKKPYCVVCETALGDGDLEGICRPCYQKAKGPPAHPMAWVKPEHLFAMEAGRGFVSFLSWLAMQATKKPQGKQDPPLTDEEARKRLDELRDRIDKGDI
jgi:hypothetical protein